MNKTVIKLFYRRHHTISRTFCFWPNVVSRVITVIIFIRGLFSSDPVLLIQIIFDSRIGGFVDCIQFAKTHTIEIIDIGVPFTLNIADT